ncbi:MAG: tetratricopeptide repeat protein [Opitutales bacterium]
MPEEPAAPQAAKAPRQGDLIIPPTMVRQGPTKTGKHSAGSAPNPVGLKSILLLIVLTLLAFAPTLNSDLLWSEYDEVERSAHTSMESWQEAWQIENIRRHDPITITSYFLEAQLPLHPAATHRLINLFLHLFAALLLLKVLECLKLPGAFAAALVFALHPAVLQTLYWPGYRTEILGLVFILASLYFGIRNRHARDYTLTILLTFIAAFLHPAALALPFVLGLAILFQHKTFHLHHYNRVLPLGLIVLFVGAWTQSATVANARPEDLSLSTQVGQNLYFFLRQALLPIDLRLFHPFTEGKTYNVGAANSLLAFLVFLPFYVLIAFNYRKGWAKGFFLGLSSFLLLLVYGLMQTGRFLDGHLAKEEYGLYIALPAIIAVVFCGLAGFFRQMPSLGKILWPLGFSLFLLVHFGLTASFSYSLRDPAHMWQKLAGQWENSWQPRAALLASIDETNNDLLTENETIRALETILAINPSRHGERIQLARLYRKNRQNTNALREYQLILRQTQPDKEFLQEAADFFDSLNLRWEANKARERITNTNATTPEE